MHILGVQKLSHVVFYLKIHMDNKNKNCIAWFFLSKINKPKNGFNAETFFFLVTYKKVYCLGARSQNVSCSIQILNA